MSTVNIIFFIYILIINIVAFIFYGIDKYRAVNHKWRIPEAILLIYAFIGGGIGAATGMAVFHHKTRKWKFRILVPVSVILWIGITMWVMIFFPH